MPQLRNRLAGVLPLWSPLTSRSTVIPYTCMCIDLTHLIMNCYSYVKQEQYQSSKAEVLQIFKWTNFNWMCKLKLQTLSGHIYACMQAYIAS